MECISAFDFVSQIFFFAFSGENLKFKSKVVISFEWWKDNGNDEDDNDNDDNNGTKIFVAQNHLHLSLIFFLIAEQNEMRL